MPIPRDDRRDFLARLGAIGGTATLFPGVLWAKLASGADLTDATIVAAAEVAGVTFTAEERAQMLEGLGRQTRQLDALHRIPLENAVAPALLFSPLPRADAVPTGPQRPIVASRQPAQIGRAHV